MYDHKDPAENEPQQQQLPNNNPQEFDSSSMGIDHSHSNTWAPIITDQLGIGMGFPHFDDSTIPTTTTTDLLTLLQLPNFSFTSSSSSSSAMGFLGDLNLSSMADNPSGSGSSSISYDPFANLNFPPQISPLFRELGFDGTQTSHWNGNGNGNNGNGKSSTLFGGFDNANINGVYQDEGDHHNHHYHNHHGNYNGVYDYYEFSKGGSILGEGKEGKCAKNFVSERQRRQNFTDKYLHLRSLMPNPTKADRATIVLEAIDYIKELKRTVNELKLLVEKKRISKRLKTDEDNNHDVWASVKPDPDEAFNGSTGAQLRSSWLQRKCKDTEVDVRIVDDDVTIKLVQRKKINCLLSVSRTLDELQLDLRHVAGGHVGDYYSYLFNTKICEGSSVYASGIANKLIEVVEREYSAAAVACWCSFCW